MALTPEARAHLDTEHNIADGREFWPKYLEVISVAARALVGPLVRDGKLTSIQGGDVLTNMLPRVLDAAGVAHYVGTHPAEIPGIENGAAEFRRITEKVAKLAEDAFWGRGEKPSGSVGDRLDRATGGVRPNEAMAALSQRLGEERADAQREMGDQARENAAPRAAAELREERVPPPLGGKPPPPGGPPREPPLPGIPSRGEPPDRPSAFGILKKGFSALTEDVQKKIVPMAAGAPETRAIPKDFANAERAARYQSQSFIDSLKKGFTKADWKRMWDIGDAASVAAQQRGREAGEEILSLLKPNEQKIMADIDKYGRNLWERGRDAGLVSGEALPFYTTRAVVNRGEDGRASRVEGSGEGNPLDMLGINLRTQGPGRRKYLTAEETEAAAKARFGEKTELVRDIRVVPLALERFERAIAGREMITDLRKIGDALGRETVSDTDKPGFFTIDHPAFKTYRPKLDPESGKAVRDEEGNTVLDRVPLYVNREFEGPLRSVLRHQDGALYRGAMQAKAGAVSLIMNSPLIHNMVEWGRALPVLPGKVVTGKVYFEGNAFRKNPEAMRQAIGEGFVPLGNRGYIQDITGLAEEPSLRAGRSITAKLLGAGADQFSPELGTKIREAIDKAGDFWHNTLLWDRIADLQAGLYKNVREHLIEKGSPERAAGIVAAHFANRYAGALPHEAMSEMARKVANIVLFSRTFKLGNLGVMKDMFTGLPRDAQALISRDLGETARAQTVSYARAKAIRTFAVDIALFYGMNAALQTGLDMMLRDKRNRVFWTTAKDGTALYLRSPVGKVGEEFAGWLQEPMAMVKRAEGTLMRPITNLFMNDRGFGRKVYDPNAQGVGGVAENVGRIAWEFMRSQVPEAQFNSLSRVLSGESKEGDVPQALLPFAGLTVSRGFPGGPEAGTLFDARKKHEEQVREAMPGINELLRTGKTADAVKQMTGLGMTQGMINYRIKVAQHPEARVSPSALKRFEREATPEEKAGFQRLQQARQAAP